MKTKWDSGCGSCLIRRASAYLVDGATEVKAVGFGDYKTKLLRSVFVQGWSYVRVPIESP